MRIQSVTVLTEATSRSQIGIAFAQEAGGILIEEVFIMSHYVTFYDYDDGTHVPWNGRPGHGESGDAGEISHTNYHIRETEIGIG